MQLRGTRIAAALLSVAVATLGLAASSRAMIVVDSFGFPGATGGRLNTFNGGGIAINKSGAGGVAAGTVFVGEGWESTFGTDSNRIQSLDAQGDFQRLWGLDVIAGGGAGFEICEVAAECKRGITASPAPGGQIRNAPFGAIAVEQASGDVYVMDSGDSRVEVFDAKGHFLRAWGWDVVKPGGTGDVSENAFEICTVAADCKASASSQSGGAISPAGSMAFDSAGHLWIPDSGNRRLQEFEPSGAFIAAYGWNVDAKGGSGELEKCTSTAPGDCQAGTEGSALGQFKSSSPFRIALDSADNVYAIDTGNKRIVKFSPGIISPPPTQFAPELLTELGIPDQSHILALPGGSVLLSAVLSSGTRLFELDGSSGQLVDSSLAGEGLPEVFSLAVDAAGAVYAVVSNTGQGGKPIGPGVVVLDDGPPQPPPGLTIDSASGIGAEEATLNVTVDPGGFLVSGCEFEYSTDQATWKAVPEPDCVSLDRDGGPQQVSETVGDLEPGSKYFVRFKAGRYYYAAGTEISDEEEFETLSLPPIVSDVGAAQITDHGAWFAGEVKPRSQSFEYHFEYGTTPALDSSTPTALGTGGQQRTVAHLIEGLLPDTPYFFKLVVTNAAGTGEGEGGFNTRPQIVPPEHRAYEQVTPPEKNFTSLEGGFPAADGEAAFFAGGGGFGDPAGQIGEISTGYRSVRTPQGWRTRWHNETYCSKDLEETHFQPAIGGSPSGYSENLDFLAILRPEASVCPYPSLDPLAKTPQSNLYRADFREVAKGGPIAYDLLTPNAGAEELSLKGTGGVYAGSSEDWSHVVYTSNGVQSAGAPAGEFAKVYDWHDGEPHLASKDTATSPPGGKPFTTPSAVPEDALHGVDAAGDRIFFMNPGDSGTCNATTCELYMRQNGAKTFDVSRSECTSSCGGEAPDQFLAATADGAKVLFMSEVKLLNEDTAATGSDLYLYTHTATPATDANLTLLSKDEEPADGTSAGVLGLLGMSDNTDVAYFAAQGQLIAGKPTAAGAKLYRWDANEGSPTLTYLTTLAGGSTDADNWSGSGPNGTRSAVQEVTSDGKYLLVRTAVRIDPGADRDEDADLYRWSEQDGWLCISCQAPTATSQGDVQLASGPSSHYQHAMSDDGAQVFFSTPDALLPKDNNPEHPRRDVYEWREDGSLELISSGEDKRDVQFLGVSTSGRDAFFITFKRLVGWDNDDNSDVYDRCEGPSSECGFPEPIPPEPPCNPNAGECEGPSTSEPQAPRAATPAIEAPPVPPKKKKRKRCTGHTRKAKRHAQAAKRPHRKPRCRRAEKGGKR